MTFSIAWQHPECKWSYSITTIILQFHFVVFYIGILNAYPIFATSTNASQTDYFQCLLVYKFIIYRCIFAVFSTSHTNISLYISTSYYCLGSISLEYQSFICFFIILLQCPALCRIYYQTTFRRLSMLIISVQYNVTFLWLIA